MGTAEFASRRRRVLEAINPAALLLFAAPVAVRNRDVEHEYRQDSDMYYLTGFEEPDSAVLLRSAADPPCVFFVRPRDPERELWDGPRAGVEGAVAHYGADVAHPYSELSEKLPELLKSTDRLYYQLGQNRETDDLVLRAIAQLRGRARTGVVWPTAICEPSMIVHEQRLVKSEAEIENMERAASITRGAHLAAMAHTRAGMFEYEVDALLRAHFRRHGCRRPAYVPVVGSGANATILHYTRNDRQMLAGDLLLVDAGCEYDYYASDVTRTWPVGGSFSPAQAAVYELVLAAQMAGIKAVRPGATLRDIHQACVQIITQGLIDLGIVTGPVQEALDENRHKPFFMHRTSHFLGMDVHDVGRTHQAELPRPLASGMVLTVEPGLYFARHRLDVPEQYRGIGVRIEDNVLVTGDGFRVLTDGIPKCRADVERACAC